MLLWPLKLLPSEFPICFCLDLRFSGAPWAQELTSSARCIFIVRRINKLGFRSKSLLESGATEDVSGARGPSDRLFRGALGLDSLLYKAFWAEVTTPNSARCFKCAWHIPRSLRLSLFHGLEVKPLPNSGQTARTRPGVARFG